MTQLVVGMGKAGRWSDNASAAERYDLPRAVERGLVTILHDEGGCTVDGGELLGDAWMLVVDAEEDELEEDPAVLAYCDLKVAWQDVQFWSATGDWTGPASYADPVDKRPRVTGGAESCRKLLREYRETGAIAGAFLDDPDDYPEGTDDVCSAGPRVEDIDWTGIDEAAQDDE